MTTIPAPLTDAGATAPTASRTVHTFCRYCMASCGLEVTVDQNRVTKISADKQNRS